jgi:NADPH:quinone reductase-like Zn-dependent oxidoreductase
MSQTGKAFIFKSGAGSYFKWEENFQFSKPEKDQVMLKVISAGLNPVDYKLPHMLPLWLSRKGGPVGMDVCGQVVSVGPKVTDLKPGDIVFGQGYGMGQYCLSMSSVLVKTPEGASDIPVYGGLGVAVGTAYEMLELAEAFNGSESKNIMVIGASGGVGSAAVQIAKARCPAGSKVTAICSGKSSDYVKSIGADTIVDYSQADFKFSTCVPPKSLDIVIDCVSSPDDYNYKPEGMNLIKEKTGKYIAANSATGFDWVKLILGSAIGINFFRGPYRLMFYVPKKERLQDIGQLVNEKKLVLNVQEYVPFEESAIRKAYETLAGRRVRGKLIVKM